jgi:hypothetical protein
VAQVGGPHVHFNNEAGVNTGVDLELCGADFVLVSISGSGTPALVRFLVSSGGPFIPVRGIRVRDGAVASGTRDYGDVWFVPVAGFDLFRVSKEEPGGLVTATSVPVCGSVAAPVAFSWFLSSDFAVGELTLSAGQTAPVSLQPLPCVEVLVQNRSASAGKVMVGNAAAQTIELAPGNGVSLPVDDASKIYVRADGGPATVGWLARR